MLQGGACRAFLGVSGERRRWGDPLLSGGFSKSEDQSEDAELEKSYILVVILIFDVGRENPFLPLPCFFFFFFRFSAA